MALSEKQRKHIDKLAKARRGTPMGEKQKKMLSEIKKRWFQ